MGRIRPITFWPAFVCLCITLLFTLIDKDNFIETASLLNDWIIGHISWLFSLAAMFTVFVVLYAYCSPIGRIKIGGENAERLLSPFRWFAVTLTTVIAMGILFWSVAEPIVHYNEPPAFLQIEPGSAEAMRFSMSTIFVHWTVTPYSIYTITALCFALCFYNLKLKFSIGSMLRPLLGPGVDGLSGEIIDGLALFSVVVGMSATLTSGLLIIADGLGTMMGIKSNEFIYGLIAAVIIGSALISSATGVQRGIQQLARVNTWLYFLGVAFIFIVGPTTFILSLGVESLGVYLSDFFERTLVTGASGNDPWPGWWTAAFFSSWFAWAPLTCLFLGKISRGYRVRELIMVNMILPSCFGMVWFSVFSGTSLFFDSTQDGLMYQAYQNSGFSSVIYVLFEQLPGSQIVTVLFIFACFITFVTAADSNTDAIGSLCTKDTSTDNLASPLWIKALWAGSIAFVSWVSASYIGVDGVRMLFNLSGVPGLIIVTGAVFAFLRLVNKVDCSGPIVKLDESVLSKIEAST